VHGTWPALADEVLRRLRLEGHELRSPTRLRRAFRRLAARGRASGGRYGRSDPVACLVDLLSHPAIAEEPRSAVARRYTSTSSIHPAAGTRLRRTRCRSSWARSYEPSTSSGRAGTSSTSRWTIRSSDGDLLLEAFDQYMAFNGTPVTRAQFEATNGGEDRRHTVPHRCPTAAQGGSEARPPEAWSRVDSALVSRLPGDPWKGDGGGAALQVRSTPRRRCIFR